MKKMVSIILILAVVLSIVPLKNAVRAQATELVWDGSIADSFDGGSGTQTDPYLIATAEQLAYFASLVNFGNAFEGQYVVLTADIYLNDVSDYENWETTPPKNNWTPIGKSTSYVFKGSFIGQNHSVQGLYCVDKSYAGLFGAMSAESEIKNLRIEKAYVSGTCAAGLVAYITVPKKTFATITNISFSGTVRASSDYSGGIFARYNPIGGLGANPYGCNISNCQVYGEISGQSYVGGIGGGSYNGGTISIAECVVNADVVGSGDRVGGVIGCCFSKINNCAVFGSVTGTSQVGGICGYSSGGETTTCINYATVKGTSNIGGIWGHGYAYPTINECANLGNIIGTSHVAGIIGYLNAGGKVSNCYNTGTVTGTGKYIGGIAGECYQNGATATLCYNTGLVNNGKGPAVCSEAWLGGSISYCYYSEDSGTGGNGTSLTANQMAVDASFAGFDFDSVWAMNKLVARPTLRNNPEVMSDASCQVTVIDKATGEIIPEAIVQYNNKVVPTKASGTATITAPGQDYASTSLLMIKKAGYDDFVCYLSDLNVSYDTLLNNTILLVPTEGISDTDAANNIYLNEHISFYLSNFGTVTKDLGFYNTVWQSENGKRLWACYVWDVVGNIGEVATLNFGDLSISADYYELYVADLILAMAEAQMTDDAAMFTKAADAYERYYGEFTNNFITKLISIVEENAALQEELEKQLVENNVLDISLKELLQDRNLLQTNLEKILQGQKTGVNTGIKVIYESICGKALEDESLLTQLFSGLTLAKEIVGEFTDTVEALQRIGNACILASCCREVNYELFYVLDDAADVLSDMNSKYGERFRNAVNKYRYIAVSEAELRNYLIWETGSEIVSAAYKYAIKDVVNATLQKSISQGLGITVPQLKVLTGTYNGTYKLLDRITKLSGKSEQYYIMNYVAPLEAAITNVVTNYGNEMLTKNSYRCAQNFDIAYQVLRFTNKYLYESAYKFAALQKDATEMQYATYYKDAWNQNNCHNGYVIDRSKYISIQCPGDIYLYDSNNELIVAIVNEEVVTCTDKTVTVSVCNGQKTIAFSADKDYGIKIQGTDTGGMTIDYAENSLTEANCERIVRFDNVELTTDSTFDVLVDSESNEMYLVDQDEEIVLPNLDTADLAFKGASLSLQHNLAINYKVDKTLFENVGYTDPYVVFELNGVKTKVSSYTVSGDRYVFTFRNIAPNQMNDTIRATLYAAYDGVEYASATREYSVAEYCYSMLELYSADEHAELRTLLVDLLHYGAASQTYTSYRTDALVNTSLTEAQRLWGTSEEPVLDTVLDTTYKTVENPTAKWKGAGLHLQESVSMRLRFTAESIEGLSVKIESGTNTWTISSDKFLEEDGVYYVYFTGLDAGQMRQSVYLTIYDGDTPVSNTVCYSIGSYAYEKQNSTIAGLPELVKAMMKYGDSAYAYVH